MEFSTLEMFAYQKITFEMEGGHKLRGSTHNTYVTYLICAFSVVVLDSTNKWYHVFVFISLSMLISRSSHVTAHGVISFILIAE